VPKHMNEDLTFRALRLLQANPNLTQRQLASGLGISLGRANYVAHALIDKGLVKAENFRTSRNKLAYAYLLTPKGLETKARITERFIARKQAEYNQLKAELEQVTAEAKADGLLETSPQPAASK